MLRDYEQKAVRDLLRLLPEHRSVVAVAPTGAGKTVIATALIRKLPRTTRVLWIAHRIELLQQARQHLIDAGLPEGQVGLLSGTRKANTEARVLVASVDMFRSRAVPAVDLFVVDEAHHATAASYVTITDVHKSAWILGLTATPERLDGEPLGDVFNHMYLAAEAFDLIENGYLLKSVVYGIPRDKARSLVVGAGAGKEYSSVKLDAAMRKRPLMADVVKERHRLARGVPTLVYAVSRLHGKELAHRFGRSGVKAMYIDALTDARQRRLALHKLENREIQVVVNVGVLTEGFDCPPVNCIVVARPTKSLALWRQMCGRAARPTPGQRSYLVLDHAGNVWRHGMPDTPIAWSLAGREKGGGDAPVKLCPSCGAMNPLTALKCQECDAEFPLTERELAERKAELERIEALEREKRAALARIQEIAKERGAGERWCERVLEMMFPEVGNAA